MSKNLVLKATHGPRDPERAHLAWNVAAVGLASGLNVVIFLAIDGVHLGLPGVAEALNVPEGSPTAQLRDAVLGGGRVIACAPCVTRRDLHPEEFIDGVEMGGSTYFLELATANDTTALVY